MKLEKITEIETKHIEKCNGFEKHWTCWYTVYKIDNNLDYLELKYAKYEIKKKKD